MNRYRRRVRTGITLMAIGFIAELTMLSGLVTDARPPVWFWSLILLIGVGGAVVVSAFFSAGRDRRVRTEAVLREAAARHTGN